MTFGTDIDIRVIKFGKKDKKTGANVDVWSNFDDYGLPRPIGLLRMDLHKRQLTNKPHVEGFLQGVVGDPPPSAYARAGGKAGPETPRGRVCPPVPEQFKSDHIPSTVPYPFSECMDDLMDGAARLLEVGGRLAFFMPCAADAEDAKTAGADETPSHPALRLVARSDQMLSTRWGRRLVTFEKSKPYDAREAEAARARLNAARLKNGGVEDLLQRMREVVYHASARRRRRNAKPRRRRRPGREGAVVKDPRRKNTSHPSGVRDSGAVSGASGVETSAEKEGGEFRENGAAETRRTSSPRGTERTARAKRRWIPRNERRSEGSARETSRVVRLRRTHTRKYASYVH